MNDESIESGANSSPESPRQAKAKPLKVLPTDRLNFEKQLNVLLGYAAASGPERKAVSNRDVSAIVGIHENTVSICNPFFQDIGLLIKEGQKSRPSDEVADYAQANEWDSEKSAYKLAGVFRKSWFGLSLIPKLTFRQLSKDEAITFLANEAKAPKEYKSNLETILEYLKAAGVIQSDGVTISLGPNARENSENLGAHGKQPPLDVQDQGSKNKDQNQELPPQLQVEPLIIGLFEKLPPSNTDWGLADRAKWLNLAASIFDMVYVDEDKSGINISLEGKTLSVKKGETS